MIIDHSNITSNDMVTEACTLDPNAVDLLCIRCGWEGHAKVPHAPWVVFMAHTRYGESLLSDTHKLPTNRVPEDLG